MTITVGQFQLLITLIFILILINVLILVLILAKKGSSKKQHEAQDLKEMIDVLNGRNNRSFMSHEARGMIRNRSEKN
jgi:hypothetical protein